MFYRYANVQSEEDFRSDILKARKTFSQQITEDHRFSFYYTDGFQHELLPVITQESPDDITWMHWGIVPSSLSSIDDKNTHLGMGYSLYERAERINTSWITKKSVRCNRCLIPATGFFCWREIKQWNFMAKEARAQKFYYYVQMLNIDMINKSIPFCFPGVYNEWQDEVTGYIHRGFCIFTCEADFDHFMLKLTIDCSHKEAGRMPCIIPFDQYYEWLNPELTISEAEGYLYPFDEMRAYSVLQKPHNKRVNYNFPVAIEFHPQKALAKENKFNFY